MSSRRSVFLVTAAAALCLAVTGGPAAAQKKAPTKPKKPAVIPGGANQVKGMSGKVGDMLFDGRWRFQVQEVQFTDDYVLKVPSAPQDYSRFRDVAKEDLARHSFAPREGYTLVAIRCLAKNGQNSVQQLDFYSTSYNGIKTALADDQEGSYQPIVYDMQSDGAWVTKKLLPGSGLPVTVVFAVPPGTKLKDLVFSLKNWSDKKVTDLRISLGDNLTAPAAAAPPADAPAAGGTR
jgi:hypothetical protein